MSETELVLGDEMLERAARSLDRAYDRHEMTLRQVAEDAIRAAFEGVPLANYGVGLILGSDNVSMVALINTAADQPALLLCAPNDDENGFDSLPCNTHWRYGKAGLSSITVSKIGVEDD